MQHLSYLCHGRAFNLRRNASGNYTIATIHRSPDYNEGLHGSQFIGCNRAWDSYANWLELPESLKSDLRITAWRLFNAFKGCLQNDRFYGYGGGTVLNIYDIGCAFYSIERWENCGQAFRGIWKICELIAKIVFPPWEYPDRRLSGGRIVPNPVAPWNQPKISFIRHPWLKEKGRYIDAKDCQMEFPNPQSISIFLGRLRALAHKRRRGAHYDEFPIYPLAKINYQSIEYLSLWPKSKIDSRCRSQSNKSNRKMIRVDNNDRKLKTIAIIINFQH